MFAYCLNNPANCSDQYGYSPKPSHTTNALFEGSGVSTDFEVYLRILESYKENGITLHHSIEGAILAWSNIYLPLSSEYEYVTYLYKLDTIRGPRFFVSQTYKGAKAIGPISPNVILGTMFLELQDAFYWTELVAMVHTHPNPSDGMHNDFPSYSQGLRGGDRWVSDLLNLPEMYIIPYKRCAETPQIIIYSDRSTWCSNYK